MTDEELCAKMLAFIATQDGECCDEWYATRWDFAATVLSDFAEYAGLELVVPAYVPQLKKPEIDRNEMFKKLLPGIRDLFELEFKKYTENEPND